VPRILKIDQYNPDPSLIGEAIDYLKRGSLIAYPTDTFYGLGVDISIEPAIERIFQVKGRERDKPILILVARIEDLYNLVDDLRFSYIHKLMEHFWPGPLTMVFRASEQISPLLIGSTGKIGIRLPNHPLCQQLVKTLGAPITATSANISGMKEINDPAEVLRIFDDRIDLLIDGGITRGSAPSTVVDVTGEKPVILREGMISLKEISRFIEI